MPIRSKPQLSYSRSGFSLLEIIIVISIMAILAGVALPVASSMFNSSARRATATELENMGSSVVEYFRDTGVMPTQAVNLMVDPSVAGWSGPYILLDAAEPVRGQPDGGLDAWGNAYAFSATGTSTIQISSAGIDQLNSTADDLIFTVDVTPVRREMTLVELSTINQAILQYNAVNLPSTPLSTTYSTLLSSLVAGGYLPNDSRYAEDAWGDSYSPDPAGASPVVRVASVNLSVSG